MARLRTLPAGAAIPDAFVRIAEKEEIRTATIVALGGVDALSLGFYNRRTMSYEQHDYRGFMEVTSLLGNITEKDGKPFLHAHGTFGRRDMSVLGGHVIKATVFPTLEFVIAPTSNVAVRRLVRRLGLNLIARDRSTGKAR